MTDQDQKIRDLYRAVVADAGSDGIHRNAAIQQVAAQLAPLIQSGEVIPDPLSWVRTVVMDADRKDGNAADEVLAAIARGQDDLSPDVTPYLDFVVTLGAGRRKAYRNLSIEDLDAMDEIRHRNVRSVNRAYHRDWKPLYDGWRAVLRRNLTMGDAVQNGDLPFEDGLFGAVS